MPLFYLDASALVKAYVEEKGTPWVRALMSAEPVTVSALAIAEVASALARRRSDGDITVEQAGRAFTKLLQDTRGFEIIAASDIILRRAASRSLSLEGPVPPLRALDSIHLATALYSSILLRASAGESLVLVAADRRLRDAATAAGLAVENPEDHA